MRYRYSSPFSPTSSSLGSPDQFQEREELRAQGLLSRKREADLKAKYSGGISMTQVKKEIKDFLLSSMEMYVLEKYCLSPILMGSQFVASTNGSGRAQNST